LRPIRSVALIEPVGGHGGMSHYDLGLCRGLAESGWHVSWYTCTETSEPHQPGVTFCPVYRGIWGKASQWKRAYRYLVGSLSALVQAVRKGERVCHLHFFTAAPEELMLLLLCRVFARKVVLTVHDVESFLGGRTSRTSLVGPVYRLAHRFIVHNRTSRVELVAALQIPEQSIVVIPHGNYLDALGNIPAKEEARQMLGLAASSKVLLFFGQIKAVKGLDILLEALPAICNALPEAILVIAGRPWKNDFGQYEEMIKRLGIAERCLLHIRYIPDEEVAAFYASADVVVLPYRRIYQSGVLLLTMSYRRTVLVSDLPGMIDVVEDGANGYTFATGSHTALADAAIRILSHDEERIRVAEQAHSYVEQEHNWRNIGAQVGVLYESLC
jgi:D-inositol-3-phosphate glycosyltransferase